MIKEKVSEEHYCDICGALIPRCDRGLTLSNFHADISFYAPMLFPIKRKHWLYTDGKTVEVCSSCLNTLKYICKNIKDEDIKR